ncbi:MAG: hypothetical protein F4081_01390 [Dehalococcoidia bacterium]|nr:hypothetical protein [Dehalococcoidia bacterium]MYI85455.1 hypothetical protein [Dehalococcoidia bacterium]
MTDFDRAQCWRDRLQVWRTTTDDTTYGNGLALLVRECTDVDLKLAALVCAQDRKLEALKRRTKKGNETVAMATRSAGRSACDGDAVAVCRH